MMKKIKEPAATYGNTAQQLKLQIVEAVNATENVQVLEKLLRLIKKQNSQSGLDEALEDIQQGRVYKADSVEDMFKQIL